VTACYLRAGGFKTEAKEFSRSSRLKRFFLRSKSETKAQAVIRQAEQAARDAKKAAKLAAAN